MATAEGVRKPTAADSLTHGAQMLADRLALRAQHVSSQINAVDAEVRDQIQFGINTARDSVFSAPGVIEEARKVARERGRIAGLVTTIVTFNSEVYPENN